MGGGAFEWAKLLTQALAAPTQWGLTARDAETEDELQSDTASCMSTDPSEGRVVSVVGANLEQVTTPVIDALQEDLPVSRRHRRLVLVSAPEPVSRRGT